MPWEATRLRGFIRFSFCERADLEPPSLSGLRSGLEPILDFKPSCVELDTLVWRARTPIFGLLNCTFFESVVEPKSSLRPVMLLNFSMFFAWSIEGSIPFFVPLDGCLFAELRPRKVPFELVLSMRELGPFWRLAPKFVMLW